MQSSRCRRLSVSRYPKDGSRLTCKWSLSITPAQLAIMNHFSSSTAASSISFVSGWSRHRCMQTLKALIRMRMRSQESISSVSAVAGVIIETFTAVVARRNGIPIQARSTENPAFTSIFASVGLWVSESHLGEMKCENYRQFKATSA